MIKAFKEENDFDELVANTYVVGVGDDCIVVDLGKCSQRLIDYINHTYKKVLGILLTHAHVDHIRGVVPFLKHFNYDIPVYLHGDDYEMIVNPSLASAGMDTPDTNFDPQLVKDDEILEFNDLKIKVIHTPFHTKGSVCYLDEEDNALFTGDTLFKESIGRTDLYGGDSSSVYPSLTKLICLNEMLVCFPGHGSVTTIKAEKANNPFLH